MANSKDRRKLRRLLLQLGHSPDEINSPKPIQQSDKGSTKLGTTPLAARGFHSSIPKISKWLIFALGVPGLYIGLVSVLPSVAIDPQDLVRKGEPFSFPIRVSNTGYMGVNSVHLQCFIDKASFGNVQFTDILAHEPVDFPLGDIGRGGYTTTGCAVPRNLQPNGDFKQGHITIVLTFRPDFSPFKTYRKFYLTALADDAAHAHWVVSSK